MADVYDSQAQTVEQPVAPIEVVFTDPQPVTFAGPQQVMITSINMPFWAMVGFILKWTLASIPALIILSIVIALLAAMVFAFLAA